MKLESGASRGMGSAKGLSLGARRSVRVPLVLSALIASVLVLSGCDEGPQGRPLNYEPGVYKGKTDQPLGESTLEALRERARYQSADFSSDSGPRMAPLARDVTTSPLASQPASETAQGRQQQGQAPGQGPGQEEGQAPAGGVSAADPEETGKPSVVPSDQALRERVRQQSLQ